ncbi:MAG TPA: alcohol dehydrogenase catalytic domain-containing protein [Symbiobacteriaceae bacterium]|jgi:L-iditol 2-dehydrogenase
MMKALMLTEPFKTQVQDVPEPVAGPGEVLIRAKAGGVCGSDMHTYRGLHPYRKPPVILGHEVSGEVIALGEGVTAPALGTRVVVEPHIVCGTCEWCKQGLMNLCLNKRVPGVGWQGTFAEYVAAPASVCHTLAAEVGWAEGSMIEPLAVAQRVYSRGTPKQGEQVAVLGQGSIGILVTLLAAHGGAARLYVTDIMAYNLEAARRIGATEAVDPRTAELPAGQFDLVYVCTDGPEVMEQAVRLCRKRARIVVVSLFGKPQTVDFNNVVTREISVLGSQTYTTADFVAAVDLVNRGEVNLTPLITARLKLDELPQALADIDARKVSGIKTVVEFG